MIRRVVATLGILSAIFSCSDSSGPDDGVLFTFRESLTTDAVRLRITDPAGLSQAESMLQSKEEAWVLGTIVRGDGGFNGSYGWHLDPATVSFAEVTIEACQTRAAAIDDDLEYWLDFGQVCIWGRVESRSRSQ